MGKWKVNEGIQVFIGEKRYVGGETFSASDDELDEHGSRPYVTEAGKAKDDDEPRQQASPKASNKAVAAPEPHPTKTPK